MPALDFELLESVDIYRRGRIALRAETYRAPDGSEAGPYHVLDFPDWVNGLALTRDGRAVLVRQYRPGTRHVTLELPGGTAEENDSSPEETMRRELEEETGYGKGRFIHLAALAPNSADQTNLVHSFLMLDVEPVCDTHTDDGEFIEVVLRPLDEVAALVRSGGLEQAMHVATFYLALAELERQR